MSVASTWQSQMLQRFVDDAQLKTDLLEAALFAQKVRQPQVARTIDRQEGRAASSNGPGVVNG
jgi:hypothetical protein